MKSKRKKLLALALSAATILGVVWVAAQEPDWWEGRGVTNSSPANNKGPANIGQAKHMVREAIVELGENRAEIAHLVRADVLSLLGPEGLTPPASPDAAWYEEQKKPLLSGQLKALAKPFYDHLDAAEPEWLSAQRESNQVQFSGSIYPWTREVSDDAHYSPALVGQLKACFALVFSSLPLEDQSGGFVDSDGDGLSDSWEILYGLDPNNEDTNGNTVLDGIELFQGGPLTNSQAFQAYLNRAVPNVNGESLTADPPKVIYEQREFYKNYHSFRNGDHIQQTNSYWFSPNPDFSPDYSSYDNEIRSIPALRSELELNHPYSSAPIPEISDAQYTEWDDLYYNTFGGTHSKHIYFEDNKHIIKSHSEMGSNVMLKITNPATSKQTFHAVKITKFVPWIKNEVGFWILNEPLVTNEVEVVEFVIQEGEMTSQVVSVNPTQNEAPQGQYSGNSVKLLPVDIKEAWSDQIMDVEVNGLPDKTGLAETPYILMGARSDGKGHAFLRLHSPIPENLQDRVIYCFYRNGAVEPGDWSYEEGGAVVRVELDNIVNEEDKDYTIVIGFDENENGRLENSEVIAHPELTYNEENSIPITYRVVGKARYDDSKNYLSNRARNAIVRAGLTQSSRLLSAYVAGGKPAGNVTEINVQITRKGCEGADGKVELGITHPVGIAFTPKDNPGDSKEFVFPEDDLFTQKIALSNSMRGWMSGKLRGEEQDVRDRFREISDEFGFGGPVEVDFIWDFEGRMSFSPILDTDLFLALNKINLKVRAFVTVHRSGQVVSVSLHGSARDIYDFNHDNSDDHYPITLSMRAAEMQAGHPTLGTGGRVFKVKTVFDGNDPWGHPDSDPFEFFH